MESRWAPWVRVIACINLVILAITGGISLLVMLAIIAILGVAGETSGIWIGLFLFILLIIIVVFLGVFSYLLYQSSDPQRIQTNKKGCRCKAITWLVFELILMILSIVLAVLPPEYTGNSGQSDSKYALGLPFLFSIFSIVVVILFIIELGQPNIGVPGPLNAYGFA